MQIKLPLLLMPLSFAGTFVLSKKDWERLALFFVSLIVCATIWSMIHYLADPDTIQKGYLQSSLIETPLENDHVRFSWLVSIAVLIATCLGWKKRKTNPTISWLLLIASAWLIIFLHVLAARTGLLSFYLIILLTALWLIIKKIKTLYGVAILFAIVVLPVTAYFVLPTFHNRVKYFFYDLPYFKEAHYLPQTTDAVRVISIKAGWNVMNEKPLAGVGFGDLLSQTKKWYSENYPSMKEVDKIYPSNEWLIYGASCGWSGFILFFTVFMIPFFMRKINNRFLWFLFNISALCLLLFDDVLEIQFGVFIYSFTLLCWWKGSTIGTGESYNN